MIKIAGTWKEISRNTSGQRVPLLEEKLKNTHTRSQRGFEGFVWPPPPWKQISTIKAQGLVTIHVNILSMYKHVQGRTPFFFFIPARFKSCLFFKFLLIYSKPCLVQLPRPYSFQKISWPHRDYLLWRRSGRFCQEFAWVENSMDPKWK